MHPALESIGVSSTGGWKEGEGLRRDGTGYGCGTRRVSTFLFDRFLLVSRSRKHPVPGT